MQKILILDFGSQTAQLIARRIRELNVYCELHPYDVTETFVRQFAPSGIILSGGPESVLTEASPRAPQVIFELGVPILGICYGMQTMTEQLGGSVMQGLSGEFGFAQVQALQSCSLWPQGWMTPHHFDVWMSHGDQVLRLPEGFQTVGSNESTPTTAMADEARRLYGVQFHPEVTHTPDGMAMLRRFVRDICEIEPSWTMPSYAEHSIETIRKQVGDEHVILGLSGGVDSSVAAALIYQAIGEQLTCVFVDHGLLRLNEVAEVREIFGELGAKVIFIDARKRFMTALRGEFDPERKRKIIGKLFVDVFQEEAAKIDGAAWLAQGTIYPDVIESAGSKTGKAHNIKSHHNVGGLPETLQLKLLEPLRELFKDEVRALGQVLELPDRLLFRHPFPGPGLAVRILGEVKEEYVNLLQRADAIFIEELHRFGWYPLTAQAFAVFLPIKSVGVMGDGRTYDYVVALRAVETTDFMTARWAHLPYELLETVSARIINEVRGINRVVYDVSSKPPATIEWE
ncbi:MAG: glutamine-hydrolyzing GMP synthase [Pseudomonadota bacterium]